MEDASHENGDGGEADDHPSQQYGDETNNSSLGSNNGWRHKCTSSLNESLEGIDEEHGHEQPLALGRIGSSSNGGGGGDGATDHQQSSKSVSTILNKHNRTISSTPTTTTAAVDHGGAADHHLSLSSSTTTTKFSSTQAKTSSSFSSKADQRSKTLYLKTAFWLTIWYSTSLATLFLNKIILSRPNSSVHVLGMCQMTTAAVLGGWSAFGGLDYMTRVGRELFHCCLDIYFRCRRLLCRGGGGVTRQLGADGIERSSLLLANSLKSDDGMVLPTKSKSSNNGVMAGMSGTGRGGGGGGGMSFHFARDMSIVGILRGVTVLLGLVALEHVPVSFVETIKATAPAFTVLFARLILQERTAPQVMLTLVPVVGGLILCSATELRFDSIGFMAACLNNCADCVQNVMSKRMLTHMKPTQLQFYTSVAALVLQTPLILRDISGILNRWAHNNSDEDIMVTVEEEEVERHLDTTEDDGELLSSSYYHHDNEWSLTKLLIVDAIFYHLQSVSAYCTMGCMNPVSQSVANTLKRALLVWASIIYFGNPITSSGVVGILMVVAGVFLYNHVRRIHQS